MSDILQYIWEYFFTSENGLIEFAASAVTLVCVILTARKNIWCFPVGIVGVILFGFLFYRVNLFADMTLQWVYFLPVSFYGWWYWYNKGDDGIDTLKISIGTNKEWITGAALLIVGTIVTGYYFANHTTASLPYPDSFILVASVFGQYLLSKKVLESWILWISVDLVAVPVYFMKELYVASGLYVIFLCIATYGLISWFKEWIDYDDWIDTREVPSVPSGA